MCKVWRPLTALLCIVLFLHQYLNAVSAGRMKTWQGLGVTQRLLARRTGLSGVHCARRLKKKKNKGRKRKTVFDFSKKMDIRNDYFLISQVQRIFTMSRKEARKK